MEKLELEGVAGKDNGGLSRAGLGLEESMKKDSLFLARYGQRIVVLTCSN